MDSLFTAAEQNELSRRPEVPTWTMYRRGGLIAERDEETLLDLGRLMEVDIEDRREAFRRRGVGIAAALLSTCKCVNKQGSLWYLLDAIDTMLEEDLEANASLFHRAIAENMETVERDHGSARNETEREAALAANLEMYKPIMRVIPGTDGATDVESLQARLRAVSVLGKLLPTASVVFGSDHPAILQQEQAAMSAILRQLAKEMETVTERLGQLRSKASSPESAATLAIQVGLLRAYLEFLQQMLQVPRNRTHFLATHGATVLVAPELLLAAEHVLLQTPVDVQYRAVFCLWMLTYEPSFVARLCWPDQPLESGRRVERLAELPKELVQILRHCSRTRTLRVTVMALENLVSSKECGAKLRRQLIDLGAVPALGRLKERQWTDPDVLEELSKLESQLHKDVTDLSSWAQYRQDLLCGELLWANPSHRDDSFWLKNVMRIEEKDCAAIKDLLAVVREQVAGPDSIGDLYSAEKLAVACNDLGRIAQNHPHGAKLIGIEGKLAVMAAMEVPDKDVQREALLATQHIMVNSFKS